MSREDAEPGRSFRLGGMVEAGSVQRTPPMAAHSEFRVTDGKASVEVSYHGVLPDLFREGQGIVALGAMTRRRDLPRLEVLAKHDETYMPQEVVEALKKSGNWNPTVRHRPRPPTWNTMQVKKSTRLADDSRTRPFRAGAGRGDRLRAGRDPAFRRTGLRDPG